MEYLVNALYIVAFSMFIYGLMGLTGPKTAVRGNQIAAVGMLIAVVATLISIRDAEMGNARRPKSASRSKSAARLRREHSR